MFTFVGRVSLLEGVDPADYVPYNVMQVVEDQMAEVNSYFEDLLETTFEKLQSSIDGVLLLDSKISQIT